MKEFEKFSANNFVSKQNFFADDANDEFKVIRENGETQGIFKVWAPHIIPFLDGFSCAKEWSDNLEDKPLKLHQSLEQWRATCAIMDRRLQHVFESRTLPTDPNLAVVELFLRMKVAFEFSAPFYNIEALVADSRLNRVDNPIDVTESSFDGGKLDAVAMLLPSVLADQISAKKLDWGTSSWDEINARISKMRESFLCGEDNTLAHQFIIVSKVASLAGISPEEVLFAANALQFIPTNVGGKAEDIAQEQATQLLTKILDTPDGEAKTSTVAKNINGLIRFMNWCPSIDSEDNFGGKFWSYDAVCATANQLLKVVTENRSVFINSQFADVFGTQLVPQLDNIDATSAKGRLLMQLLSEGKFGENLANKILKESVLFNTEINRSLDALKQQELVVDVSECMPTFLVGGKADGIRKATQVFGSETVLGGKVLTSEAVITWIEMIDGIDPLLRKLNSEIDIDQKINTGQIIINLINNAPEPLKLISLIKSAVGNAQKIVLRSSSFDEDVPIIGPTPGIYESVVDVTSDNDEAISDALKVVVSSFFSEKAISFRELKHLQHRLVFAVLIQEFVDNIGGTIFINNGETDLNIANQACQINTLGARFDEIHNTKLDDSSKISDLLTREQLRQIILIAKKSEKIFGPGDLEFAIDPNNGEVKILQLRSLHQPSKNTDIIELQQSKIVSIDNNNFDNLPDVGEDKISIRICNEVNLEKFQGALFRWIARNGQHILSIILDQKIPTTCHFANIVGSFGIKLIIK